MNVQQTSEVRGGFSILETTSQVQTAVMRLQPGESSAETPQIHAGSDQVVLVMEGGLHAEVGDEEWTVPRGGCFVIPSGTPHRLVNRGPGDVFAFTTYSPPAYPG